DGVPAGVLSALTSAVRRVADPEGVPQVDADLPGPGRRRSELLSGSEAVGAGGADVFFFPSCTGALFGPASGGEGASGAFVQLCRPAGWRVGRVRGTEGMWWGRGWAAVGW